MVQQVQASHGLQRNLLPGPVLLTYAAMLRNNQIRKSDRIIDAGSVSGHKLLGPFDDFLDHERIPDSGKTLFTCWPQLGYRRIHVARLSPLTRFN